MGQSREGGWYQGGVLIDIFGFLVVVSLIHKGQ